MTRILLEANRDYVIDSASAIVLSSGSVHFVVILKKGHEEGGEGSHYILSISIVE